MRNETMGKSLHSLFNRFLGFGASCKIYNSLALVVAVETARRAWRNECTV